MNEELFARFQAKYDVATSGCWVWAGARTKNGYGNFAVRRRATYAHRVSYEHFVGPIPSGLTIDHLCRNRLCVNPEHLEAVTMRENLLRGAGVSALNVRKTHCPHGHPYSENNTYRSGGTRKCRTCVRLRTLTGKLGAEGALAFMERLENAGA